MPSGIQLDSQAKALFEKTEEVMNFIALGVDMIEYQFLPKLLPHTSISMAGTYHSTHWRTYEDLDTRTFEMCVNFVETLLKKAEELERKTARLKHLRLRR